MAGEWVADYGQALHSHSAEDFVAGRFLPGLRCPDCPPAPPAGELRITEVDFVKRTITVSKPSEK